MGRASRRSRARATCGALVTAGALFSMAGCSNGGDDGPAVAAEISDTVPIGAVPGSPSDVPAPSTPPNLVATTTTSTTEPITPLDGPIGEQVDGGRLLLIGDAVLARTAPRFDGIACDVLTGFGWSLEVAAEPGRFIEFGNEVLDQRLVPEVGEDWDAVVVLLGNLFDGDIVAFEAELTEIIERLEPRPVVLFTLTEVDDEAQLNDLIRAQPERHPNVAVIDWAEISAAEPEILLENGGPLPTDEGAGRIVVFIAGELGRAPVGDDVEGECLPEVFTDDSAIVL